VLEAMRWEYIFSGTTHHSLANYTGAAGGAPVVYRRFDLAKERWNPALLDLSSTD